MIKHHEWYNLRKRNYLLIESIYSLMAISVMETSLEVFSGSIGQLLTQKSDNGIKKKTRISQNQNNLEIEYNNFHEQTGLWLTLCG